ncbi:uroporphyrinogen-III synthase [Pseudomonas sp. dw_358]|uniref:uroporphyrinogen-III synthase n=1 Tax=Pseudomonas sp. dw_358 TaxID=2720083 RepID=UPI001BD2C05A|nr:uroporphyrinogen-III synthase [Pseudomonas sp. dw_358]
MNAWRPLLTRPAEDSAALAAELAQAGFFSSTLPLLEIQPLPLDALQLSTIQNLAHYAAVIAVSKPAARLGARQVHALGAMPITQPWFAVGAGTAAILHAHGLSAACPTQGDDSETLLALPALQTAVEPPGARVLILRGEGGREALAEGLRGQGVHVDYLQLYRRHLPAYARGTLLARVQVERLNALVVSSGQGFEHLLLLAAEDWLQLAKLTIFAPSRRVADQVRAAGAQNVVDCRGANAAALLMALRDNPLPAPM